MRFWIGFLVMIGGLAATATLRTYDNRLALGLGLALIFIGAGIQIWCFYEAWLEQRKMFRMHKRNIEKLQDLQRRAEEATTDEEKIAIIHELCDENPEAAKGFLNSNTLG